MDPTLDDIRLKDIEELTPDEKKVVSDNFDKLTKEEQDYYKPVKEDTGGEEYVPKFKTQKEFDEEQSLNKMLAAPVALPQTPTWLRVLYPVLQFVIPITIMML